jgi:acetyl esterase/lipase
MPQAPSTLQTMLARDTHVYKTANGHDLEADVIGAHAGANKPCVVWIHGGGLIFGSRKVSPRATLLRALLDRDFVVVSIDHRLAPETKLPGIVDDVRDAWRWLLDSGPRRFGIDPSRVAMAGASAGAYLSLLAGYLFEPRPRALASFFGYGDITAPWEAEPSAHYRQREWVTREEADASLSAPPMQDPAIGVDRSCFYLYCRQQGKWLEEVTAHDPREDASWFDRFCPLRNVTPEFPPTVLVHGEIDTDVPHAESSRLAARLAAAGVEHRFISLPGVGHGFAGARPEEVEATEIAVAEFLRAQSSMVGKSLRL